MKSIFFFSFFVSKSEFTAKVDKNTVYLVCEIQEQSWVHECTKPILIAGIHEMGKSQCDQFHSVMMFRRETLV